MKHKRASLLGFKKHNGVINIFKKTSITVACSRWEEPFGRTSLEASANGCAVVITNRGGLPETVTDAVIISKLNVKELTKIIQNLIDNPAKRKRLQKLSIKNFYLTHEFVASLMDNYRSEKISYLKRINLRKIKKLQL